MEVFLIQIISEGNRSKKQPASTIRQTHSIRIRWRRAAAAGTPRRPAWSPIMVANWSSWLLHRRLRHGPDAKGFRACGRPHKDRRQQEADLCRLDEPMDPR